MTQFAEIIEPCLALCRGMYWEKNAEVVEKVSKLLEKYAEELKACPNENCDAMCLSDIRQAKHEPRCQYDVEWVGIYPVLAMAVEAENVALVKLIQKNYQRWQILPDLWLDAAFSALKKNNIRLVKCFGWQWLSQLVDKGEYAQLSDNTTRYAQYALEVVKNMQSGQGQSPCLIPNMLGDLDFLFPKMPQADYMTPWGWLIRDLNHQPFLNTLGYDYTQESTRQKMVMEYGILWDVSSSETGSDGRKEIICSLVRYVLFKFVGRYKDTHKKWLSTIAKAVVYQEALVSRAKELAKDIMSRDISRTEKIHLRVSLASVVPVQSIRLSQKERALLFIEDWMNCCRKPRTQAENTENLLASEEHAYVF